MKTFAFLLALCGAGCAASVGTSGSTYVPKDAASTCASHCNEIGLALGSVVIMASTVGCVCSAAAGPGAPGAAGGGMAAIMLQQQQQRRQSSSPRH